MLKKVNKLKLDTIVFSKEIVSSSMYLKIKQELDKYGIDILNILNDNKHI